MHPSYFYYNDLRQFFLVSIKSRLPGNYLISTRKYYARPVDWQIYTGILLCTQEHRDGNKRTEITFESVGLLTTAASQVVATLIKLLDPTNEPSVRLNASKAILAALAPMAELGEFRSRLDALERAK